MTIAHVITYSLDVTRATYRLKLLLLRMRRGTVTLADNALMAKEVYKNFFEFVDRSPVFLGTTFPHEGGFEMRVYLGEELNARSATQYLVAMGLCLVWAPAFPSS